MLQASIGHSLEIKKLLPNYDHTVVTDFLKVHGASITPLIGQLRWLLLTWMLFSIFTNAGLLYCSYVPEQTSWRTFWQGGATYFFSFLKISFFFWALTLVWTLVIWMPTLMFLERSFQYFPSEKYTVWLVFLLLIVWLTGLAVLFVWSILSRMQRLRTGGLIWSSIKSAGKIFRQNKARFMGMLGGFALLQLILTSLYFALEALIGMVSPWSLLTVFLIQQAFVFSRIQIRQMMYAGIGLVF